MPTLLTAGDGTNGAVITSANDNALTIQTGPNGGKVNAIALASDGTATLLQPPKLAATATVSMVRVQGANGYGSTNTTVRRFTNVLTNQGSDITYADSASNGATFTINTNGVYAISGTDVGNGAQYFGISRNGTTLTTAIQSIAAAERLSMNRAAGSDVAVSFGSTMVLTAGDVIRQQGEGATGTQTQWTQLTITKVA